MTLAELTPRAWRRAILLHRLAHETRADRIRRLHRGRRPL